MHSKNNFAYFISLSALHDPNVKTLADLVVLQDMHRGFYNGRHTTNITGDKGYAFRLLSEALRRLHALLQLPEISEDRWRYRTLLAQVESHPDYSPRQKQVAKLAR